MVRFKNGGGQLQIFLFYQNEKCIDIKLLWFTVEFKLFVLAPDLYSFCDITAIFFSAFQFTEWSAML